MSWLDSIKRALGMVIVPSVDFLGTYRARVVAQSADFRTVDVVPDDRRIAGERGLSKVPILLGLPGCTVNVAAGCYVRLGWRGGDPRQPYVTSWESGASVTGVVLSADAIDLAGTTYHLPKTEDLLADLKTWVSAVNAVLASNCVNGAPMSGYAAQTAALVAFVTSLNVAGSYRSTKVRNG